MDLIKPKPKRKYKRKKPIEKPIEKPIIKKDIPIIKIEKSTKEKPIILEY